MGLFDRSAKRLASGPSLILPADPADAVADALAAYDPAMRVRADYVAFGNGVRLHGPVDLTPELTRKAELPAGTTAYYADVVETGSRGSRPDHVKWQDAELLVRGLAVRLGGTVHNGRPPMDLRFSSTVYSAEPLPAGEVIGVLQPYTDGELYAEMDEDVQGAYFLLSEQEPAFLAVYWPPRLSRSRLALPPPALGDLAKQEPCRWELRSKFPAADAAPQIRLTIGEAALALARRAGGVVIDPYGFPVGRPEDLLAH